MHWIIRVGECQGKPAFAASRLIVTDGGEDGFVPYSVVEGDYGLDVSINTIKITLINFTTIQDLPL